jgi:hypothetical protein
MRLSIALLGSAAKIPLLKPGALGKAVVARSSGGAVTDAAGAISLVGNDVARFQGTARRLLVEGSRTNVITNPRAEGGAAGVMPTNWGSPASALAAVGITFTPVGPVSANGMTGMRFKMLGTANAAVAAQITFAPTSNPASQNQTWTGSLFGRIVSGTKVGLTTLAARARAATTGFVQTANAQTELSSTADAPVRLAATVTAPADGANVTAVALLVFQINCAANTPVDIVFDIFWPQMELGGSVSSPVLPSVGTLAASTRAADSSTLALSAWSQQRGTLVGTFMLPVLDANQALLTLDDGTANNRVGMRYSAGGLASYRTVAGSTTFANLQGTITAGTVFRAAMAWTPDETVFCLAGGTLLKIAGVPTVNRGMFGRDSVGFYLFGEIGPLDLYPVRLSDAQLQALTA